MVNNSELAFRLLVRQYGVQLTYTPMINAKAFIQLETEEERKLLVEPHPLDRPLIVQFCSDDPDELLAAALKVYCPWSFPVTLISPLLSPFSRP